MNEKETSIQEGRSTYQIVTDVCEVCGRRAPWRYIHNDKCQTCCSQQAADLYNIAVSAVMLNASKMQIEYRPDRMGRTRQPRRIDNDELQLIYNCLQLTGEETDLEKPEYYPAVTSPEEANKRKLTVYLSPQYCVNSGHVGVKTLSGKCYFCQEERHVNNPRHKAIVAGEAWYMPDNPCPKCGKTALRRTNNGSCSGCSPQKTLSVSPRQAALRAGITWYMPDNPCPHCGQKALKRTHDSRCSGCVPRRWDRTHDSPRQEAIRLGQPTYIPDNPCPRCGQLAPKRVNNGQCLACFTPTKQTRTESPRQAALRAGETWYTPTEHCSKCGKIAPRRVSNGQCSGCAPVPPVVVQQPTSTQWMAEHPDMIITREMARTLGLKIFRTGRTCRHGNTGWKWVSTGNCVACK